MKFQPRALFLAHTDYKKEDIVSCRRVKLGFSNAIFHLKTKDQKQFQVRFGLNNDIIYRDNERAILDLIQDQTYLFYDPSNGNSIRKGFRGRNPSSHEIDLNFLKILVGKIEALHAVKIKNHESTKHVREHDNLVFAHLVDDRLERKHGEHYLQLSLKYKFLIKVLSHNDVSLLNIIYDARTEEMELIDFEGGRLNNHYGDYANFIREANLTLDSMRHIARLAKLEGQILLDHVYLCTCFAVQGTFSMPQTPNIVAYYKATTKLMNYYYELFYNSSST